MDLVVDFIVCGLFGVVVDLKNLKGLHNILAFRHAFPGLYSILNIPNSTI